MYVLLFIIVCVQQGAALHLIDIEGDVERVEQSLKDIIEEIREDVDFMKDDILLDGNKILNTAHYTVVDLINDSLRDLEIQADTARTLNIDIDECNVEVTIEEVKNMIIPEMTNMSICANKAMAQTETTRFSTIAQELRDRAHEIFQKAREADSQENDLLEFSKELIEMRTEAYLLLTEERDMFLLTLEEVKNEMEPCVSNVIDEILTLSKAATYEPKRCATRKLKIKN